MRAGGAGWSAPPRAASVGRVGYPVLLIIVWLGMEYWRPPNPMKIPFAISLVLLAGWLLHDRKRWNPQIVLLLLFVGQMTAMIPFTENNYAARLTTREAFTVIVCIAIPMAHFIDTLRRFQIVVGSWCFIFACMAVVAVANGGIGPGGARGGVDENYTALFMTVAIAFAYFMAMTTRRWAFKLALLAATAMFVAAIIAGMSRGGFLGLVGVAGWCWWRSPRKLPSLAIGAIAVLAVLAFAPESYWEEVNSIGDTSESTASLRFTFWKIAWWIYLDNPILGIGPGNFPWVSGFYQSVDSTGTALGMNVTHSFFFELLSEMGTTGVILVALVIYFNARDLRLVSRVANRERRKRPRRRGRRISRRERVHLDRLGNASIMASGLAAAFIGFFVCSVFLSTLYYTTFWLLTGMTVALREATLAEVRSLHGAQTNGSTTSTDRSGFTTRQGVSGRFATGLVGR